MAGDNFTGLDYQEIIKELRAGRFRPLYFLHGPEAYFIDAVSDYVERHALEEAEKAFNQTILYGKEVDFKAVIDAARRYPMMAQRQVVLLKEAQEMQTFAQLQSYFEQPAATTVLVICYKHKKFNLNSTLGKVLKAQAVVLDAKSLYDNQVPEWIAGYLQAQKLKIAPQAAALVAEYLGNDLSKVVNELDKLALNVPAGSEVTPALIEQHIGISREYNVFELQNAIGQRNIRKANLILRYFASNPKKNPMIMVVGTLYNFFSKVYLLHALQGQPDKEVLSALQLRSAYFLKDYRLAARHFSKRQVEKVIGLLREYDLKSKGVEFNTTGTPDTELMREMVWKILH